MTSISQTERHDKLENKLQIILITYNRCEKLQHTMSKILSMDSPIKNCSITVLDNRSTDGTYEFIESLCKKFDNIIHVVHNVNIGGNANIARAFEIATMQYLWILCDDDDYDFSHFDEIETAIISDKYDCIVVERLTNFSNDNIPYLVNELSFVPAGIYKTKNISSTVMQNVEVNIAYSFPHLALVCHLINIHANFYIAENPCVKQIFSGLEENCCRDMDSRDEIHFRIKHANLYSGYINSYTMIIDKKLRKKCCSNLWLEKSYFFSMKAFLRSNGKFLPNIFDVFWFGGHKIQTLAALLFMFFVHYIPRKIKKLFFKVAE